MKSLNIIIARTYIIKRPNKINTADRCAPADFFLGKGNIMSKFTEELRTISIKEILTILVSSLVTVLVTIGIAIRDPLENIVLQNVPKSILLTPAK